MAKVKAAAKTTPVKKMRASTEVQSDSDFEDSNVENGAAVVAEPETPKSKPKAKPKPKGPANGVQKAKNTSEYKFLLETEFYLNRFVRCFSSILSFVAPKLSETDFLFFLPLFHFSSEAKGKSSK